MSGTSLDGIDAALIRTDGETVTAREGFITLPYDDALRARIRALFNKEPDAEVARDLTIAHAETVEALLKKLNVSPGDVDVIGFHGQTISHAPDRGHTCQIGDGALLARMTGIDVVDDLRVADVKAGGQGAPLAPVYHRALAAEREKPVVFLNMGGVANVTYMDKAGALIAFDTGPGNALLDDWMLARTGKPYDAGGATAQAGTVNADVLAQLKAHPYFTRQPPKSLDRDDFASSLWSDLSTADGAATLAAFTIETIADCIKFMPSPPLEWVVSGGGRHNVFFMNELKRRLPGKVTPLEVLGLDGDATEAEAWAFLAVRSLRGLPLSFPATTGVKAPLTGGVLHRANEVAA
jgi:anhydro-N-acetylmuramic acid kinase